MAPNILLLKISADASLLEHKCTTQEFIIATNAVFFKAQGLAMLVPLHEMVFGLLEGLLDDWHLLNLDSVEWAVSWEHAISTIEQIRLMHFKKMVIELELTAPVVVPRTVVDLAPTPASTTFSSTLLPTQEQPSQWTAPCNKGKGKAKAMEDNKDEEDEATQKLRKELEDFMVPTKFDNELLVSLLLPPLEYYEGNIGLPQGAKISGGRKGDITLVSPATWTLVLEKNGAAAKAFLEQQGKLSQFFVLEGYKGKGKAKALLGDSEQMGAKQTFKLIELVDSDSDKEEEEERVHIIKKIKHKHIEEPTGTRKGKEIIELEDEEVEIVVPKTPAVGPSCQTSKLVVLVPSMPKPIPKPIVALASPVAGPSTAHIVPSSVSNPASAVPISKPAPVKSAGKPAIKGGFVSKDPFMVRQFKLAGTEESSALIINQVTEVAATQETLQDEDSSNKDNDENGNDDEGSNGDDDNSDNDDATMDIDSGKHLKETQPMVPTKATVTEVEALVPVPVSFLCFVQLSFLTILLTNKTK
ncbi:hypothetical protein C0995_000760 [Termitomyces sp. Mi166|nr:hypothetical protein C0995_000760 [Termitomyces sp. Mi166\